MQVPSTPAGRRTEFAALRELDLSVRKDTEATRGLATLPGPVLGRLMQVPGLRRLDLYVSHLGDSALGRIAGASQLTRLSLQRPIDEGGRVDRLSAIGGLADLELAGGPVSLAQLAVLTTLTRLVVASEKLDESELGLLAGLTRLRELGVGRNGVTAAGVAGLATLTSLEELYLSRGSDVSWRQLGGGPPWRQRGPDDLLAIDLAPLAALPRLRLLTLCNHHLYPDEVRAHLRGNVWVRGLHPRPARPAEKNRTDRPKPPERRAEPRLWGLLATLCGHAGQRPGGGAPQPPQQ